MKSTTYRIRCYRRQFGDVDVSDIFHAAATLDEAKQVACERLLTAFNADHVRPGEQPYSAALCDPADTVIATFEVLPKNPNESEVVEIELTSQLARWFNLTNL